MPAAVYCGVPSKHCTGHTVAQRANALKAAGVERVHNTPEEAYHCKVKHLLNVRGAKRLSDREFRLPEGGILMLRKKGRCGIPLKKGKEGRLMFSHGRGAIVG